MSVESKDMPVTKERACYLGVSDLRLLDHWCETLRRTFFRGTPYLVGSVLQTETFRDVDVRILLDDEDFHNIPMDVLDLNMMLSQWGKRVTGLPIDCQVQSRTIWHQHDGKANPRWIPAPERPE